MPDGKVPREVGPHLDEQLCFAIYQAGHAFTRAYRPVLAALGLTYPQYLVMLVLWEEDGVAVKAVGDRLSLDSGTLTPLLKRLEASGLIRRSRSREDERRVLLHLTRAGAELRAKGACVPRAIAPALGLDGEQAAKLAAQLHALAGSLRAAAESGAAQAALPR